MMDDFPAVSDKFRDLTLEQGERELDAVPVAVEGATCWRSVLFHFHFPAGPLA